jgi:hypothetical protein
MRRRREAAIEKDVEKDKLSLPAARRYICDRPQLYWSAPVTEKEARCLTALLNSKTARQRGESLQSRGHARDFDKVMFNLPIPRFDTADSLHNAIAGAARAAEVIAASVPLPENIKFQRARGLVRAALTGPALRKGSMRSSSASSAPCEPFPGRRASSASLAASGQSSQSALTAASTASA